jgi:hypothetical protein
MALLGLCAAQCAVPEPGTPVQESTPLFDGYRSYQTVADVKYRLPDRSTWHILADVANEARDGCPRFDQLTLTTPATHLGHSGELQLGFINGRLESTLFFPHALEPYLDALRTGMHVTIDRRLIVSPATEVWAWQYRDRAFVGWRDTRLLAQVTAWVDACS